MTHMMNRFKKEVLHKGYSIVPDVLSAGFVKRAKDELMTAIDLESRLPYNNSNDRSMVMLCSLYGGAFLDVFTNRKLLDCMNAILGEGCTAYAYTSSSMPPNGTNFSNRIHVDCPRVIPGYITNLGVLMALDDFTEENGASYYLPHSQDRETAPSAEEFYAKAERFVCKAGTVIFFNARVWHSGGQNKTDRWRHGISINMARPWMKQRLDIPRAMSHMDLSGVPDVVLQKLGFHAQVPTDYASYYVPPAQRAFKQNYE